MPANIKLECCEHPITLEEQPANYGHQFIGRCEKCGNTYGIEDLTEIVDEFGEESDNDCEIYTSDNLACSKCELSDEQKRKVDCPFSGADN